MTIVFWELTWFISACLLRFLGGFTTYSMLYESMDFLAKYFYAYSLLSSAATFSTPAPIKKTPIPTQKKKKKNY